MLLYIINCIDDRWMLYIYWSVSNVKSEFEYVRTSWVRTWTVRRPSQKLMMMIYQQTFKLVEEIEGVLNIPPPRHAFKSEKIPERILDNITH